MCVSLGSGARASSRPATQMPVDERRQYVYMYCTVKAGRVDQMATLLAAVSPLMLKLTAIGCDWIPMNQKQMDPRARVEPSRGHCSRPPPARPAPP